VSYRGVLDGLKAVWGTVPELAGHPILDYEPTSIQDSPTLYMLLDRAPRQQHGQVTAQHYVVLCRLVLRWLDNERAEQLLVPFVNALPAAIDADKQLGGALQNGVAVVEDMRAVFVTIGGTLYRALDVYVDVLEKAPFKSGI
jgi:hypothetical protein